VDELKNRSYEVTFARQFIKKGRKFSLHMVILYSSPENIAVFYEREIVYNCVKIEAYRNNDPAQ